MKGRSLTVLCAALILGAWASAAQAARQFSITQINPAAPGQFDMGTAQSLTLRVTNTSTGDNSSERIYEMRFRLNSTCSGSPCTATLFASSTAAPAGWTRTAFSSTSVTFRATSWDNSIATGSSLDFTLVLNAGTSTQDRNQTLRDARASFTLDTNFANGISRTGRSTVNSPGSWTLKSLAITSFQTTDASGNPVSAIAAGTSFRLVLTVRNISTATQSGIVASPSPPTMTRTGTWTPGSWPNCSLTGTSPSPLNLAPGASGTITYTCTTASSNSGTVYFTATVRNSSGNATSRTATSNTLSVSPLVVGIAASPSCIFPGDTATFVMTVTNNTGSVLSNVTPSALTRLGSATIGAFSGPTPASVASLASGATATFTWTAPVTGTVPAFGAKPDFAVSGSASANGGSITSPLATSPTVDLDDYLVAVAALTALNAASANAELSWAVTNRGCAEVSQVAILPPGGWSYGGDSYSLVNNTTGTPVETWTAAATTFSAPSATDRMGLGYDGDFNLVFTATPAVAGPYSFTVRITDSAARTVDRLTSITVNPYGTGGGNDAASGVWREEYR